MLKMGLKYYLRCLKEIFKNLGYRIRLKQSCIPFIIDDTKLFNRNMCSYFF